MYTLDLADLARQKGDQQEAALLEAGAKEAARVSGVLRSATTGPKHSSENKEAVAEEDVLGRMTEEHWPPSQTIDADLAQRIQLAEQHLAELRAKAGPSRSTTTTTTSSPAAAGSSSAAAESDRDGPPASRVAGRSTMSFQEVLAQCPNAKLYAVYQPRNSKAFGVRLGETY